MTERQKRRMPKGNSKAGRPSKMTPIVISKLEQAFSYGCTDREACLYADILPETFYEYQARNPSFADRKELLKEKPILLARQRVVLSFQERPDIALKYLERKVRNEFATKTEVENTFPQGIAITDTRDLPDDKKLLEQLKKKNKPNGK